MDRKERIYQTLYSAAEQSFSALFRQHPEHYYYAALIMMDAAAPCITAMSEEVLSELGDDCKWDYAESPYLGFEHNTYFNDVNVLFQNDVWDPELDDDTFIGRVTDWQRIMVKVMKDLSENGVFAEYPDIFINAESYPPEGTYNYKNAEMLNTAAVFKEWEKDNSDCEEDEVSVSVMWEVYHPTMCSVTLVKLLQDKKAAVTLRKEFVSTLSMGEFLKACESLPFVINKEFRYREAQKILAEHHEYADYISISILPQKTDALPF